MRLPHVNEIVPGGIKRTDHWHAKTNDGTCSRCRRPVPDRDVPLMLWSRDGLHLLLYCEACVQAQPAVANTGSARSL